MAARPRNGLEEGPILHGAFIEHYWRVARRPAKWAARWVAVKMHKLGVPPTARVLDIGCGPGWLPRYLARRFPAMRFVAVDVSEPMVRRAGAAPAGEVGPTNVRFVVGDGYRLPFGSGRFDLVISGATLHHLSELERFFDEVDRVLAANGHAIISDLNRDVPWVLWPLVRLGDWIERWLRPAAARDFHDGIANSFRAAYDEGEIRRALDNSALGQRARYYRRLLGHWIQTPVGGSDAPATGRLVRRGARHDTT